MEAEHNSSLEFYFDLRLSDRLLEKKKTLASLFKLYHWFFSAFGEGQCALDFPAWSNQSPGDILRVLGPKDKLSTLHRQSYLVQLAEEQAITLSRLQPVPEINPTLMTRWTRERSSEKITFGAQLRQAKRREKRAALRHEEPSVAKKPTRAANDPSELSKAGVVHWFQVSSTGTKQPALSLFIQKSPATRLGERFSSYGLSQDEGGIPSFTSALL